MIYLDASVVSSLYVPDSNSAEAFRLAGTARETLLVSALCELEAVNAFGLRVFRGEMSKRNRDLAANDLESDIRSGYFKWMAIPEAAFTHAKNLVRTITPSVGVRTADLLHVAAALELGAHSIYSFDHRQLKAAEAAGLMVNNSHMP